MTQSAYIDPQSAVARSVSHDETAYLALPEDIPGRTQRERAALDELRAVGLLDWSRENDGSITAWGDTPAGDSWQVRLVDGLVSPVRYLR